MYWIGHSVRDNMKNFLRYTLLFLMLSVVCVNAAQMSRGELLAKAEAYVEFMNAVGQQTIDKAYLASFVERNFSTSCVKIINNKVICNSKNKLLSQLLHAKKEWPLWRLQVCSLCVDTVQQNVFIQYVCHATKDLNVLQRPLLSVMKTISFDPDTFQICYIQEVCGSFLMR